MHSKQMVIVMPKKPIRRKKVVKPVEVITPPASKNIMGLSGFAMIILTNYQAEIKQSLSIIFGFLK
ncbi:hypothetical protein UFOVP245_12 [uncultured Caudovirales phage]|uniref:Uncharacterized protein n=1 Tax=uncultured Caudovirales phage TaxID=2100421 RepID=A0A6J7WRR1_9CAUD|nr:hypothetical protein UFOVP245_12 [uncultured Caudovirales phage]